MDDYTFEMMYEDLRNGNQIYNTNVRNRYLILITAKKSTLKRVKEIFPFMEDIEYKVGI